MSPAALAVLTMWLSPCAVSSGRKAVGDEQTQSWSMFEVVDIGPGFDVGAHLHRNAEELFYVLEGQLDLLAFEPRSGPRTGGRAGSRTPGPRWPAAGQGA